ncbi:MAG: SRPBCC domain-containing protein [Anaerolineae bacterium]|nr:SRPBCC domain-containing protein [Anaerolineae bacterium]
MEQNVQNLIVKETIEISAPITKVWEVLVTPRYIKEWDDVPEGFADDRLRMGTVLEWPGHARLTVVTFEPYQHLSLVLVAASWQPPIPDDIAYTFNLAESEGPESEGQTILTVTVGDFGRLPDGQDYYDASVEFAQTAVPKIKELAEK